ncbi:hypothetical protein KCU77_g13722, partial [Aureobasidium melanogenum]
MAGRCRYERSGNDHYATIELSDKLVDDPVRLLSTLAHEFCHLANDMLGDDPRAHGFGFKEWSRKYKAALSDVGVEVTTYHNFSPKFKFIWICSNDECGEEIGRHSNSIDPEKQGCPHCGSNLVQTNPVARVLKSRPCGAPSDTTENSEVDCKFDTESDTESGSEGESEDTPRKESAVKMCSREDGGAAGSKTKHAKMT